MKKKLFVTCFIAMLLCGVIASNVISAVGVENSLEEKYSDSVEQTYDVESVEIDIETSDSEEGYFKADIPTGEYSEERKQALAEKQELKENDNILDTEESIMLSDDVTNDTSSEGVVPQWKIDAAEEHCAERVDTYTKAIAIVNEKLNRDYKLQSFSSKCNKDMCRDVIYLYFETELTDAEAYYLRDYISYCDLAFSEEDAEYESIQKIVEDWSIYNKETE